MVVNCRSASKLCPGDMSESAMVCCLRPGGHTQHVACRPLHAVAPADSPSSAPPHTPDKLSRRSLQPNPISPTINCASLQSATVLCQVLHVSLLRLPTQLPNMSHGALHLQICTIAAPS